MHVLALVPLIIVLACPVARADTPPLAPEPIRRAHNAAVIAKVCLEAKVLANKNCATYAFCKNPLSTTNAVPTDALLTALEANPDTCPVVNATEQRLPAAVESDRTLGSTWQADVLNGLVSFLVSRAKAEALASLVHHLKKELCAHDVAAMAPVTCALLKDAEPYTLPVSWSVLKAAFETDLRALPQRLIRNAVKGDLTEPLVSLVEVLMLLEQGAEPFEVLAGLRTKYEAITDAATCKDKPYSCALRVLGGVVEVMAPPAAGFPPTPEFTALHLQIAARMIVEDGAAFGLPKELLTQFDSYAATLRKLRDALEQARRAAHASVAARASAGARTQPDYQSYTRAVANVSGLLQLATFGAPVFAELKLPKITSALDHLVRAVAHARAGAYVESFVELQAALSAVELKAPAWFSKYGGFVAEVAAARSKDDVKQALEAAAAPVGAWRQKRGRGRHALTINGYLGLQGGLEWLGGSGAPSGEALHGGMFAPIGLEASFGFADDSSVGLLFSAMDLGALVDFRESGDNIDSSSTLGFRQVFSPGLYGVLGLGFGDGGIPLTLGLGVSLSPELRSVDLGGGVETDLNAVRLSAFLAIDITIFGL